MPAGRRLPAANCLLFAQHAAPRNRARPSRPDDVGLIVTRTAEHVQTAQYRMLIEDAREHAGSYCALPAAAGAVEDHCVLRLDPHLGAAVERPAPGAVLSY